MKRKWFLLPMSLIMFAGCDYSHKKAQHGLFYTVFVKPISDLLHVLGYAFSGNHGLVIIVIVFILRLILISLMCIQVKNIHVIHGKTDVVKPEIDRIQERIKEAQSPEERRAANKLLMKKYNEYGVSPFKNLIGTFPILIQIPILLGLYTSIKHPTSNGVTQYPHFLWFNLMHTDTIMTIIAAVMYFIQPLVNSIHCPKNERRSYYIMMILSPLFVTYASLHSASALSLYWAISTTFLVIQMHFAHSHYAKVGKIEGEKLRQRIEIRRQTVSETSSDTSNH